MTVCADLAKLTSYCCALQFDIYSKRNENSLEVLGGFASFVFVYFS